MNMISSLVILLLSVSHKRSTALASRVTRLRSSRQVSTTRRLWEFFTGDFSLIFLAGWGRGANHSKSEKY